MRPGWWPHRQCYMAFPRRYPFFHSSEKKFGSSAKSGILRMARIPWQSNGSGPASALKITIMYIYYIDISIIIYRYIYYNILGLPRCSRTSWVVWSSLEMRIGLCHDAGLCHTGVDLRAVRLRYLSTGTGELQYFYITVYIYIYI